MSSLPIVSFVLPAELKDIKQGFLPDNLLRDVKPYGKLYWKAADAWDAMVAAAAQDKVELKPVSAGDTYRSYAAQEAVFLQRYTLKPLPKSKHTRKWNGKTWYLKPNAGAQLAAPGGSIHNWGCAVDVHTASGDRLEWLKGNAIAFGWSWEVVPSEPWHLRCFNADQPTPAVQMWLSEKPKVDVVAPKADATEAVKPKPRKPKA